MKIIKSTGIINGKLVSFVSCLLFYISFSMICFSQQKPKYNSLVKINATSIIDIFSFPTVQFSYERQIGKHISFSGEFGWQMYNLINKSDTSFVSPNGLKANLEIRFYNHKIFQSIFPSTNDNALSGYYLGLNFFYRQNRNENQLYYQQVNSTSRNEYADSFWLKKSNFGLNIILGFQHDISRFVIVDIYAGLGIMNRTVTNYNMEYNSTSDTLISPRHDIFGIQSKDLSENNGWKGNLTLGIRIGIKIHQSNTSHQLSLWHRKDND